VAIQGQKGGGRELGTDSLLCIAKYFSVCNEMSITVKEQKYPSDCPHLLSTQPTAGHFSWAFQLAFSQFNLPKHAIPSSRIKRVVYLEELKDPHPNSLDPHFSARLCDKLWEADILPPPLNSSDGGPDDFGRGLNEWCEEMGR